MPIKPMTTHTGVALIALLGAVAVLYFAREVLVPVALAIMMAFLLAPMVGQVERWGANREIAVTLTALVVFSFIGLLLYVVAHQFMGLIEDLPSYRDNLLGKIRAISGGAGTTGLERGVETVKELTDELQRSAPNSTPAAADVSKVQIVQPPPNFAQVVRTVLGPLLAPVATAAIVLVFSVFMLIQREDLRDRLVRLLGANEMHTTVTALDDAAQRVSRYLLMQSLINGIQGTLVAAGLYALGVPDAMLWGALTFVLRFIPYLGPVLAAAGPIALAIAFFPGWGEPLMVAGLIVTLELISNNVLEPRLYGSSVGVSSFALIVAAVFWTWLWGTAGLFLATPLTVCLAVMGKYIPQLSFLGVMLTDQAVLAPSERFYQRLLANDTDEAEDLIDEALAARPLVEVCDTVLMPALRFIEQDHERGAITTERRDELITLVGELIDQLPDTVALGQTEATAGQADSATALQMTVLVLPAADHADELAAQLMVHALPSAEFKATALAVTLKGEMLEQVASNAPDAICISATPPSALIHARYLCKKMRARFPELPIVVGLWDAQGDLQKSIERLVAVGAAKVVGSAAEALRELTQLRQPLVQGVVARADEAQAVDAVKETA